MSNRFPDDDSVCMYACMYLVEKDKDLVRSIEKTRVEKHDVDFADELRLHEWEVLQKLKKERKKLAQEKDRLKKERKKLAYEHSYDRLFEDNGAGGGVGETKDTLGLVGLAISAAATSGGGGGGEGGEMSSKTSLSSRATAEMAGMFDGVGLDDDEEDNEDEDLEEDSEEEVEEDFM